VATSDVNLGGPVGGGGPVSGAIYTSLPGCLAINHNIYSAATDVYLNGGPQGNTNLSNGSYYVAVTTPGGNLLGWSSSRSGAAATPFIVTNGVGNCIQLWDVVDKASSIYAGLPQTGFDATDNPGGEYKVWISKTDDFASSETKTDNFKVREIECTHDCGPTPSALVAVYKFYDVNGDGIKNGTDSYLTGWAFQSVAGLDPAVNGLTNANNPPTYVCLVGVTCTFQEGDPNPVGTWQHSTPTVLGVTPVSDGEAGLKVEFGNFCVATTGRALTLGAYSGGNTTYQNFVNAKAAAMIVALPNLFDLAGVNKAPTLTTYNKIRTYFLGASATNMAYMLSVQMATMWLNTQWNPSIIGTGLLYAPSLAPYAGVGGPLEGKLNANNVISVFDVIDAAKADLALPGHNLTVASGAVRNYQEALKTVLDRGNNNLNWVAGSAAGCGGVPSAFTFPALD